jgi:hypothetical protein
MNSRPAVRDVVLGSVVATAQEFGSRLGGRSPQLLDTETVE